MIIDRALIKPGQRWRIGSGTSFDIYEILSHGPGYVNVNTPSHK